MLGPARRRGTRARREGASAVGIGSVDNVNDDTWRDEREWNDAGYVDDSDHWWPDEQRHQ
eukprot:4145390-Pyramimonas_sp.AAC.1